MRTVPAGSLLLLWVLVSASACAPLEDVPGAVPLGEDSLESLGQPVDTQNGLSVNGLSLNGLSLNGLSLNGLSLNGLSSRKFSDWLQQNPALFDGVMKYVVRCAVPAGETRTYTSPTGRSWTWAGSLGLAPSWSGGQPASLLEQRVVSACLAAHANKFGVHIAMSVQGLTATGSALPTSFQEFTQYPEKEGCFFGNLFNGEGVYAASDRRPLNHRQSTPRACALSIKRSGPPECEPMIRVEPQCADICTLDATKRFYVSCTYNTLTYPAITTRLLETDIYTCGNRICEVSESCGTGNDYDDCEDCGPCP